ncbi:EspG family protein [Streptoalloteichus tenebrarius]|uniref:EspG family protein n=1 Tax=Streptoalloteichus tenebrarius (strain ATCC 17920 / DSM 40477 / JCM 4838 / CBS 697.72 / NBRC 16177 / NCIMB 11028 / NRRL B-12390 / A12253. 1 / ISP 5477) TaxID=1933 RepID=A0ABT1I2Y6_STRSD|nr:ESX secretion-associated protein EspG [Streptoalloteichus tenebrarius]MCP2262154.1 EspG family protein [Streptoalloteichus tenebrarius]BFF00044.1 ESX secretion-associated protein EspG [Streptoalloteichus tenebrarius]
MLRASVALSALAFDVLWQDERLGDKPNPLSCPSPGATYEERAELERTAWAELEQVGLARHGRADEDLVEALHLVRRPAVELFGWVNGEGGHWSLLAAAAGPSAVLAVFANDTLELHPVRVDALAEVVVSALPEVAPARGHALSVPVDAVSGPRDDGESGSFLHHAAGGGGGPEVTRFRQVMSAERRGVAQLYAAVRDSYGQRRRVDRPLTVLDTVDGRWLVQRRPGNPGPDWLVAAPVDRRLLVTRLSELRAELGR